MEPNCVTRPPFFLDLLTGQRKRKIISQRSEVYFPDRVLSTFYDSILENHVPSLDSLLFAVRHVIFASFIRDL